MRSVFVAAALAGILLGGLSHAVETKVVVRAQSKDAKFIGSAMGGARVTIRESETGRLLAEGLTQGGTGDTQRIMIEAQKRGTPLSDATAAKFEAVIDIDAPTLITIEAAAPVAQPQAVIKSGTQMWLIPGKDVAGDGVILEIPGIAVDILSPQSSESVQQEQNQGAIPIEVNVVMMCGCPITPGGLWDAQDYEVRALVKYGGQEVQTLPLDYAGKPSTFQGRMAADRKGVYEVWVYAYQPSTGNSGVDRTTFVVR